MTLTPADEDALRRAFAEACRDPVRAKQLAQKAKDEGLIEPQITAAYSCQTNNLKCKPWELPPMYGDAYPGHDGHVGGALLLKRLLDAGLSRYEPDPLGALSAIEARAGS